MHRSADARSRRTSTAIVSVLTAICAFLGSAPGASAQEADGEASTSAERELAERYAPSLRLKDQTGQCDRQGEQFEPTAVDIVLGNPDVTLRQAGVGDPVVARAPTAADLEARGEGFFLDFNGLALEPGCVYERDFRRYAEDRPSSVYARVVQQDDQPDQLALQYWIYWYFNDWNNTHESDWEFVQLMFDAPSVEVALTQEPASVGYAQHEGGERAGWDDDKLERDGDHPVVYPSAGSHASYYTATVFLGRSGSEGFGCDDTTGPSRTVEPEVILLPTDVESATGDLAWLGFDGRWGERHSGPFNGPTGPAMKERWLRPVEWHDGLRAESVSIPGGGENSDAVLDTFCSVVEFGSDRLRAAQLAPERTVILLVAIVLGLRFLVRRTEWSAVPPVPLRRRRRVGQMLRSSATSLWTSGGEAVLLGCLYLPAALIIGAVGFVGSYDLAQAVSGLFTAVLYVVTVALVTAYWHLESRADEHPVRGSLELVRRRAVPIGLSFLWTTAIVVGLSLTIIGIPWAIRQVVRYQFAVPVAAVEGRSGRDALRRSSELVRGRWLRTAVAVGTFSVLGGLVLSAVQLVLLVALSWVPLWLYVGVSFLASGLVVPMVATAPVLLYGDAVAQFDEAADGDVDDRSSKEPSLQ